MKDSAREMLLDFIFEIGDPEELFQMDKLIRGSKVITEALKREGKKVFIEMYLDGEMTTEQEEYFNQMLAEDQEMVYELSLREKINEAIETELLNDTLDKIYKNNADIFEKESIPLPEKTQEVIPLHAGAKKDSTIFTSIKKRGKHWIAAASIAILVLLGAGVTYHMQNRDSIENRLYSRYYEPFDETVGYLTNSGTFNLALQKYKKGEYKNAYVLFQELPPVLQINAEKQFYTGLILMEMEQYNEAILAFNKCTNENNGAYFTNVEWYKGLCYLKMKKMDKAKEIFRAIASSNVGYYKKAGKILKKLE